MKNNLLSIEDYRNNPEFYFCKGIRCANKRNIGDAYKNLVKATMLEPENSEYKFNMACFLSELQQPREANRVFNDILLNFDPTLYDCYFGLGCNYLEIGDAEKAAESFDKYLYFDGDGEFSQEVQEMIFYLRLYNNISHDNKFIETSKANLRRAKKSIRGNGTKNVINELYRAISSNPLNIEARNLLTLALIEKQQYRKAEYINQTVKSIVDNDVWANCLCLYILSSAGKHSRVNKFLDLLTVVDINDRDDLLCIATTLLVFNKINELVKFLEMNIVQYTDNLIYSILLLGYTLSQDIQKADDIVRLLLSSNINKDLRDWVGYIKENKITAIDEYEKLFEIYEEPINQMYTPNKYRQLLCIKKSNKQKVGKKFLPIIECALEHREIMYTPYYEKEIIQVLNSCLSITKISIENFDDEIKAYSAAIEYIYCKENYIEMEKEELIKKYDISLLIFNNILKKINY